MTFSEEFISRQRDRAYKYMRDSSNLSGYTKLTKHIYTYKGKPAVVRFSYGGFYINTSTTGRAYISTLYVHPNMLHKGYGSKLIVKAERIAKAEGCSHIELLPTEDAKGFYDKLGYTFQPYNEYYGYYVKTLA